MGRYLLISLFLLPLVGCDQGWNSARDLTGTADLFGAGQGAADSDGDGIPDDREGTGDIDGDGWPNHQDTDSDGDGIPDGEDDDVDGDGLSNEEEGSGDDDGDGIPNDYDLDSDGDGIPDSEESGDDDDATGDDDDSVGDDDDSTSSGDDDDSVGDDDDSVGDDDDSTSPGDDDDSVGDDDDSTSSGADVVVTADITDFGVVAEGTLGNATITIENQGGALAFVDLSLTDPIQQGQFVYSITGGNAVFSLYSGDTETRYVQFTPPISVPPGTWTTDLEVDWGGPSILVLTFSAETQAPGEGDCTDGLDGDGDGLLDCDDPDCNADPACVNSDFCCETSGDASTNTVCWDQAAVTCTCNSDPWCCNGGWDAGCSSTYQVCGATCSN